MLFSNAVNFQVSQIVAAFPAVASPCFGQFVDELVDCLMRWRNHQHAAFACGFVSGDMGEHGQLQSFSFACARRTLKHNNLFSAENSFDETVLLGFRRQLFAC